MLSEPFYVVAFIFCLLVAAIWLARFDMHLEEKKVAAKYD